MKQPSRLVLSVTIALVLCIAGAQRGAAQTVTTGGLTGTVVDQQGGVLPGATIAAVHGPTGTTYDSATETDGRFTIPNMRVGPYSITAQMSGFRDQTLDNIYVKLGETVNISFKMVLEAVTETINVIAESSVIDPSRAGTATSVETQALEKLPTVSRSLADFARIDPNFVPTSQGQGATIISVAGRNNRYNNIQIDGAVNNDLFGLADSGTPGGQTETQPISLDAIQELQLLVSPYDVRQGGFSGGGINAITRSGTNRLRGTAYYFGRDDSLVGEIEDRGRKISLGPFGDKQLGGSVGGRIVENKAFFFGNVDYGRRDNPSGFSIGASGQNWGHQADVDRFLSILRTKYGYDPGRGGDATREFVRTTNSDKIFVRTDFNASNKHRLTVRHNYVKALNDIGFPSNTLYYFPDNFYRIRDKTNSTVVQLNSTFGRSFNELRVTYQTIRDRRGGPTDFPFVRVFLPDNTSVRAGRENFSTKNSLDQEVLEITNDYTMLWGKHTLTVGTHNELFDFDNLFIRDAFGNYTFSSLDLFEQGLAQSYDYSFSVTGNPNQSAQFSVRQFGFYAGDQWRAGKQLTVTYGVRVDLPVFPDKPTRNPLAETAFGLRTDVVPKSKLWSPRVGFNYDLSGDGKEQVRGGVGLFTGRTPYVWLSNQYGNTGNEFTRISVSNRSTNRLPFVTDPNSQPTVIPGAVVQRNEVDLVDPDYEFPSLWRGNLAYDRELGIFGLIGTAEVLFSKTVNDVKYQNVNLVQTTTAFDGRPVFGGRREGTISDAIFLTNTGLGNSWNLSFKVERPFRDNWFAQGSYAYGRTRSSLDATSSQAASNWGNARTPGDPNNLPVTRSNFDVGSRIALAASYDWAIGRGFNLTTSAYYNGQAGRPYSHSYNNTDVNGDARTFNDLLFVPANASDVVIRGGTAADLDAFINGDPCLAESRGRISERNCGRQPWTNTLDVKFAFGLPVQRAKVELTLDILNFLNLLNSDWGRYEFLDFQTLNSVAFRGIDTVTRQAIYDIATVTSPTFRKFTIDNLRSRWQAQFGARIRF
ncbi:MAG: TonB-dependent receptor [Acidobacteria bacterium]|nr:TonB-dependent receptor [Acidobacteriota bacterium]